MHNDIGGSKRAHVANELELGFHGLALTFVCIVSLVSVLLLCVSYFDVRLALGTSIILTAGFISFSHATPVVYVRKLSYPVLVLSIIVVAVLLRVDIYPHLMGGQDPGLYTNMAQVLLREKGLYFVDKFRQELTDNSLREAYDAYQMASAPLVDSVHSLFTIEFYPLHPLWMAIFSWLFGTKYQTLSLLLFSGLYLAGGSVLAATLFKDSRAGVIALAMLAVNPALVFFSKFPVTEMVALAFSVNGLLFLYRGFTANGKRARTINFIISVLAFNAFFYTRIQFFIFIPFLGMVFLYCLLPFEDKQKRTSLAVSILAIGALFFFSIIFYYRFQPSLAEAMLGGHIASLFSRQTTASLFLVVAILICGVIGLTLSEKAKKWLRINFHSTLLSRSGYFLLLAFLCSIPSVLALYKTGSLSPFPWQIPTDDPWLVRYHAIYRLMVLVSPVGFLGLLLSPYFTKRFSSDANLLFIFLGSCWLVILLQPAVPYLYYYGRYLAGEMVPYSLIAISGMVAYQLRNNQRILAMVAMTFLLFYQTAFSLLQYGRFESEKPNVYSELTRLVLPSDIVLAYGIDDRILVPLRIAYQRNIFALRGSDFDVGHFDELVEKLARMAGARGSRLILMSPKRWDHIGEALGVFQFENRFFSNAEHLRAAIYSPTALRRLALPTRYATQKQEWFLYKVESNGFRDYLAGGKCERKYDFTDKGMGTNPFALVGFGDPENHGRWSIDTHAHFKCLIKDQAFKSVTLSTTAFVYDDKVQRLSVVLNGKKINEYQYTSLEKERLIKIPMPPDVDNVRLDFFLPDAISPKDAGMSEDGRKLAISIGDISFE